MSELLVASQARLWALELDRLGQLVSATDRKGCERARRQAAEKFPHRAHPVVDSKSRETIGTEFWFGDGSRAAMYFVRPGQVVFDEALMQEGARVETGPAPSSRHDLVVIEERSRKA
jgi:hypothetical protein